MSMAALRRRRVVLAGNGGDAGGGEDPGGGGDVTPFFEDSFAGGTTNPTGGFLWSNPQGGLENTAIVAAGDPGAQVDSGYTHSLQTTFPGSARPGQVGNRQLNFTLGRSCNELWLEWRLHIPSNYAHRNNYDPGPPVEPYTDNNKFITLWGGAYSSGYHQPSCELDTNGVGGSTASDGKSYVLPKVRYTIDQVVDYESVAAGTLTSISGHGQLLIGTSAPLTPGAWHTVRFHVLKASAIGALDGVWEMWVDGTLVVSFTGLPLGSADPAKFANGVEYGYLLGYANSGFDEDTTFHTQYVKFYDTNPGW